MNNEIIEALNKLAAEKNLSKEFLVEAIEAALVSAYRKNYPDANRIHVSFDKETGEAKVFNELLVVEDEQAALDYKFPDTDEKPENLADTILLEEARQYIPDLVPGDTIAIEVKPDNFGRIATLTAKQVILQRIREAERNMVLTKYQGKVGQLVTGRVQRVYRGEAFIELDGTMAKMARDEKIEGEFYDTNPERSELLKFLVVDVLDPSDEANQPKEGERKGKKRDKSIMIYLSRARKEFVARLFELEVPEIHDGVVEIVGIVRRPGKMTKVAVRSLDMSLDALGACVGNRGSRVQRVVNELRGERVDIISWSESPRIFVANALSPAQVLHVDLNEETRQAKVVVKDNQKSLAIGDEGINHKLAVELTGYSIDIMGESEYRKREEDALYTASSEHKEVESGEEETY